MFKKKFHNSIDKGRYGYLFIAPFFIPLFLRLLLRQPKVAAMPSEVAHAPTA